MNIPNLPTDNLYKFIAIFGLLLFGFTFYLDFQTNKSLDAQFSKFMEQVLLMNKLQNEWSDEEKVNRIAWIEYMIDDIWEPKEFNRQSTLDSLMNNYIFSSNNQGKDLLEQSLQLESKSIQIENLRGELMVLNYQQKIEKDRLDDLKTISRVIRWLGFTSIIIGFILWYSKYQIYIDAETKYKGVSFLELAKEAEELKKQKNPKIQK